MTVKDRVKLVWTIAHVAHYLVWDGPVPTLVHGNFAKRGWFAKPSWQQLKAFRRDMLKAGIEVYNG